MYINHLYHTVLFHNFSSREDIPRSSTLCFTQVALMRIRILRMFVIVQIPTVAIVATSSHHVESQVLWRKRGGWTKQHQLSKSIGHHLNDTQFFSEFLGTDILAVEVHKSSEIHNYSVKYISLCVNIQYCESLIMTYYPSGYHKDKYLWLCSLLPTHLQVINE